MSKLKAKERTLKAVRRGELVTYRGTLPRSSTAFSAETLQAWWEWHDIFKVLNRKKEKPCKQEYSDKVIIQNWRRDRVFQVIKRERSLSILNWPHKKC